MYSRVRHIILIFILVGLVAFLTTCFKTPPKRLKSKDISMVNAVSVNNQDTINLTQKEVDFWSNLNFEIVTSEYPGETPDFVIDLMGENNSFTAMYNREESIVYFSFVPEIEYGFLNSPPPGGWLKPLYKTKTTNELLKLLKVQ